MKKRALWWLLPVLVLGAILWGVNWRLDHPPLSKIDFKFRAAVAGADELRVSFSLDKREIGRLRGKDVADFVEGIHLAEEQSGPSKSSAVLLLRFFKKGRPLGMFGTDGGQTFYSDFCNRGCALNRRSAARLEQTFDAL